MRVFISFAARDADLAAQLEAALRHNNIETRSRLDVATGEDWKRVVDAESADADAYIFLLGAGASADPQLQAEWRWLLRNDWESNKPLLPIIHGEGGAPGDLPPFLRDRRAVDFDAAIGDLRYLFEHLDKSLDRKHQQRSRVEQEKRLNELKEYALSLKGEGAGGAVKP